MSDRSGISALFLFVLLLVVMSGCGREGRPPNAVAPFDGVRAGAPNVEARYEPGPQTTRGLPFPTLIAEAKEALGAVLTGEQVYYQRWGTFIDVSVTADLGAALGVYLGELPRRWVLSVGDASVTGFLAKAEGRDGTDAEGITVTLMYQIGEAIVWTVQRRRPCGRRTEKNS
jgi:hypothetical protein